MVYLKTLCRLAVNFFIFSKKISSEPLQTGDSFLEKLNYKFSLLNSLLTFPCWIGYSSFYFSRSWSISSNLSNILQQSCLQYPLLSLTHRKVYSDGPFCVPNIAIYIFPSFFLISLSRGIQFYLCFQITNF